MFIRGILLMVLFYSLHLRLGDCSQHKIWFIFDICYIHANFLDKLYEKTARKGEIIQFLVKQIIVVLEKITKLI